METAYLQSLPRQNEAKKIEKDNYTGSGKHCPHQKRERGYLGLRLRSRETLFLCGADAYKKHEFPFLLKIHIFISIPDFLKRRYAQPIYHASDSYLTQTCTGSDVEQR